MSIIEDIGVAGGFIDKKKWVLTSLDDQDNKFTGQFAAENLVENVGARFPETTPTGQQVPVIQFQSGETETISFRARIFRTSPVAGSAFDALSNPVGTAFSALSGKAGPLISNGSVKDQIEKLKSMARVNPDLGRPERFVLTIGTELEFEVILRSPGAIQYDDIRSDGTIRGASFDMQLVKIRPENLTGEAGVSLAAALKTTLGIVTTVAGAGAAAGLINIPGASLHTIDKVVTVKEGDTFEKIARREYGNPVVGDVLRRVQPDKADPRPGDKILTIKKNEILQIQVTPQAIPLKTGTDTKALLDTFLGLRGKKATLII